MKYKQIKSIITSIGNREIINNVGENVFDCHFPSVSIIDFLAKIVYRGLGFEMVYLSKNEQTLRFNFPYLCLHKKSGEWYLGYYLPHRKKHFSNFYHFFSNILQSFPLYFLVDGHIVFSQYIPQNRKLDLIKKHIQKINEKYNFSYDFIFCKVLSQFANTDIVLKIIVQDCEGSFYVTLSKIWLIPTFFGFSLIFDNVIRNWRLPDYIQRGSYIINDKKIVQILYKNKILYSAPAFTEEEMEERKDYLLKLVQKFIDKCNELS